MPKVSSYISMAEVYLNKCLIIILSFRLWYLKCDGCIAESQIRLALIDFLKGLVEFDPAKRWSPLQVIYKFLTIIEMNLDL